ncbi:LCP family protein [Paenalkalicoccus suaedae]|uniref:Regulatory protein MsrR n=1 Tax=Paenalkalicoccus suaedae TaxID=2592382 RepID=A0A859FHT2_9BACI|nr:LCP family protein [Paenalkalicoccus suaedae]QKS71775.1 LCP family protein [Paenalkalicoccus suaedae]
MTRKSRRKKTWLKVFLLTFLLVFLGGVVIAAWAKNNFDAAREESLQQIEEEGGLYEEEEEIEFEPSEPEDSEPLEHINILFVGVDSEDGGSRTDTIMIGRYDPDNGTARLASIMRDTYVDIPGRGKNKINAAYAFGGMDLLRETIEENFDFPIEYYARVNFRGFERVVDVLAPDGVAIDVDDRMYYEDTAGGLLIDFDEGENIMDGEEALNFVRFRSDSQNDFGRVGRQQQMIDALSGELLSLSGITRIPQLLGSIVPYIQTNLDTSDMINYTRSFLTSSEQELSTITIPVAGGFTEASYSHAGAVLEPDLEGNKELLERFFDMDEPFEEDEIPEDELEFEFDSEYEDDLARLE